MSWYYLPFHYTTGLHNILYIYPTVFPTRYLVLNPLVWISTLWPIRIIFHNHAYSHRSPPLPFGRPSTTLSLGPQTHTNRRWRVYPTPALPYPTERNTIAPRAICGPFGLKREHLKRRKAGALL